MKPQILSLALAALVVAGTSFAQTTQTTQQTVRPSGDAATGATTTTTTTQYNDAAPMGVGTSYGVNTYEREHTLRDESIGIIPQFGDLTYTDLSGNTQSRALVGIGLDFNFLSPGETPRDAFFGLSTGGFYSHLGSSNASFWGGEESGVGGASAGANLVMIPANLKIGHNFTDAFRASIRGGGNVIYRSASFAANLGEGSNSSDSSWKIYPDVGMDLEFQVGKNVALIARPDLTIAPGNNMFTGTLGATIMPSF